MNLTSLQLRVLVKLANPGRMTVDRLVEAVMPRKMDREKRPLSESEIRLQIDLLTLHGLITCIDQNGVVSRNPRFFRHPSSSPATSASRSINLPSLWNV